MLIWFLSWEKWIELCVDMGKEGQFLTVTKFLIQWPWAEFILGQKLLNQQVYLFASLVSVINQRTSWLHVRSVWKTCCKLSSHFALCLRKMAFTYLRVTKINMCCHSGADLAVVSYSSAAKACTRRCSLVLCWVHVCWWGTEFWAWEGSSPQPQGI